MRGDHTRQEYLKAWFIGGHQRNTYHIYFVGSLLLPIIPLPHVHYSMEHLFIEYFQYSSHLH